MKKLTLNTKWVIPVLVWVLLAACSNAAPVAEQPEATASPAEEVPTVEPETPPETKSETEPVEDAPEISQPIARWNAVSEQGNWVLIGYGETLNPTVVQPGTYVTINFNASDDQVNGSGGCNNYFTSYTADDEGNLTINGPVGSTMMACETGMEQETMFLGTLETVTGYTVTENGRLLLDYDSGTVYDEQLAFIPETALVDTVWVLTSYGDPNDLTLSKPGVVTTAIFSADGTLNGFTGCNNYIASYTLQENQIAIDLPVTNLMACGTGMEQEQAFMQLLEAAQSYRLGVNALEITSADGAQVMRFNAQNIPLENVRWLLASIDGQALPEGVSASALFTPADSPAAQGGENSVNGSAGCNTFFGPYTLAGDTLTAGPFGLTMMMCEEPAMQVEHAFLAGLESAQSYQITGDQLVINTAAGSLLFYADRLPLEGPQWILTGSGPIDNPQPPIEGAVFTAVFNRQFGMPSGVKSGETGCNNYTATYFAAFDKIKVNLPQTSQSTCSDAQMEAEQGYFLGLNSARDYRILGNEMYVYYDNFVLIFVGHYPAAEAGPLAPLDGTLWQLTSIDTFIVVPGSEVTILFEINSDGRTGAISGSGGCNTYSAEITDVFTLGQINASTALCDTPEGVMELEASYLNVLQNANGVWIEASTLRITTNLETLYFTSSRPEPGQPTPTPEALAAVVIAPSDEHVGQTVIYDGSLSTPKGDIQSYRWWFTGDASAEGVTVERTYDAIGAYDAILTVTDASGQKSEASVKVKIHNYLVGPVWVSDNGAFTLIFGEGTLSGNAGCNDYSAGYTTTMDPGKANDLSVGTVTATEQLCDENVMNKEKAYLASLEKASSYTINIDSLSISTPDGFLNFYAAAAAP